MKKKRNLEMRIWTRISLKKGAIILRQDFRDLGGYDQVGRALRKLVSKGKIAKIGYGLYTKMEKSILSGRDVLCKSLPELGREALQRLGVKVSASKFELNYNTGKSTQVPTGCMIGVKSKVSRKIGYGGYEVYYEYTPA